MKPYVKKNAFGEYKMTALYYVAVDDREGKFLGFLSCPVTEACNEKTALFTLRTRAKKLGCKVVGRVFRAIREVKI